MFKKAFKVASTNSLSGKDKKKLIADLSKFYEPESINVLFEKSNPNIVANKLQGSKIQIYIAGDVPLFVDATSKGDFFPTIYTFQQVQTLSKSVEVNPGVDSFLIGGANLMWTGVKNPNGLGDFNKDDVRYIKTAENKIIAVGAMACSSQELAEKGAQGTAMFILHVVDDKLWAAGPQTTLPALIAEAKKEAPAKPSGKAEKEEVKADETAGKKSKQEKEKEPEKKKEESESEEEEEQEEEDNGADDLAQYFGGMIKKKPAAGGQSKPAQSKPKPAAAPKKTAAKKVDDDFDDDDDDKKKKGKKGAKGKKDDFEEPKKNQQKGKKGKKPKESDEEDEEEEDEEDEQEEKKTNEPKQGGGQQIPTKIVDEYVMEAFLTALKISVDDGDLPLAAADLYSKHMVPCKREGISIDLKNSSYQKMGKFLQSMAKLNIIEFKESKKGAAPQITKIHRQNAKLADFEPVVAKSSKKDNKEEEQGDDDRWPKVDIVEVFKVKEQILQFFPEDAQKEDKDKLYTREEVQNAIQKYINKHNLLEKKHIKLNDEMKTYFWVEKAESEEEEEDEGEDEEGGKKTKAKAKKPAQFTMSKEDLFKKLEDYLVPHYKIINLQTKQEEVKAGVFKGLTLVAEKSHNKSVTNITGLEPFLFNIPSLVSKFQSQFECSVTTHTFKEKNVEKTELTVHGGFIDEISDYLVDICKIDRKYINSTNKLGNKKKEKVFNI